MDDLPARLQMARHHAKLTQQALAERLGIRQPHYCKVERGDVPPSAGLRSHIELWLKASEAPEPSLRNRRAIELARSIQRQSRELARLLRNGA